MNVDATPVSESLTSAPAERPPRCFICGGAATQKFTMPLDPKTFKPISMGTVYGCTRCTFGFIHPRPTPEETAPFYELDAYYTQGRSHFVETPPPGLVSRIRDHIAWRLDAGQTLSEVIDEEMPKGSSIVDIGCGGGRLLRALAAQGHHGVGVERDGASKSRQESDLVVYDGSAEDLPTALERGSFDGVVFSHVLEHLVDPEAAFRKAADLLKPTGLLFCEVPNNESLIARQSGLTWEHLDIPRHVNHFNERSLTALAEKAGLRVRRVYFAGYCRYFSDSYIATERRIFDRLSSLGASTGRSTRNSNLRSWLLLVRTALRASRIKYDSIGIVADRRA